MDRFLCAFNVFYLRKTDTRIFSLEKKKKRLDYKKNFHFFKKNFLHLKTFSSIIFNAFLSNSVVVSFTTKVISVGISNPTPIPLFIFVPVTLQLAYDASKGTCLMSCLGKETHVRQLLLV